MLFALKAIANKLKHLLFVTILGTLRLAGGTVSHAVRLAYLTIVHSLRALRMTIVATFRLTRATVIGTFMLARATIVGTFKLIRATIRLNIKMWKAAADLQVRYFKSWLRRSRFEWVILRNLHRAPYLILKLHYWSKHPERYSETQRFMLVREVIYYIEKFGHIKTYTAGRKNLPKEGGYVMFPNHQGKFDALGIVMTHPSPCTVVMDEKKSHVILTSQVVDALQGKRLEIDNPRQTVTLFNEIAKEVRDGRRFIIFPEGGYENENGNQLGFFKPGAFKAAIKAKAPIVPVALIDSYRAFNSSWFGTVRTYVHYLKPIFYEEYRSMTTAEIAEVVKARIEERIRIGSRSDVKEMMRRAVQNG